jgi:hypothetical protein
VFGRGVAANAVFHLVATVWSRAYCPGVVTGLVVYQPLALVTFMAGIREGVPAPTFARISRDGCPP